jgi:hypothetical protein
LRHPLDRESCPCNRRAVPLLSSSLCKACDAVQHKHTRHHLGEAAVLISQDTRYYHWAQTLSIVMLSLLRLLASIAQLQHVPYVDHPSCAYDSQGRQVILQGEYAQNPRRLSVSHRKLPNRIRVGRVCAGSTGKALRGSSGTSAPISRCCIRGSE